MLDMNARIKYWLLDKIMDEVKECEQAIEAHRVLARDARSSEETQAHYGHICDLSDFIDALKKFQEKVRNGEVI